jgi:hypothetical protein
MTNSSILKTTTLLGALATLALTSCGCDSTRSEGDIVTENRSAKDFHALDISVPGKVLVHTGPAYAVVVQGEESAMPYLETEVKNGSLHIYFSKNVHDVDDLVITVTAPAFDEFEVSGSGEVIAHDPLDGLELEVKVSGSGDVSLTDVDYDRIDVDVSGSGDVLLQGIAVQSVNYEVSGSGGVEALDCPTPRAIVKVSGSGTVRCHALDYLRATVSGSGDVLYFGSPSVDADVSGSGKVRKI